MCEPDRAPATPFNKATKDSLDDTVLATSRMISIAPFWILSSRDAKCGVTIATNVAPDPAAKGLRSSERFETKKDTSSITASGFLLRALSTIGRTLLLRIYILVVFFLADTTTPYVDKSSAVICLSRGTNA